MSLYLDVHKITIQKDRLIEVDAENFDVERFKRAVVDASVHDAEKRCDIKLIVDLRARVMTVVCSCPDFTAGRVGLAILVEYARFSGVYGVLDRLAENPDKMLELGRFGIGSDSEHFLGFLHYVKGVGSILCGCRDKKRGVRRQRSTFVPILEEASVRHPLQSTSGHMESRAVRPIESHFITRDG